MTLNVSKVFRIFNTAIYGARGANGVLMITTKRGISGEGVKVSYNGYVSLSSFNQNGRDERG